MTHTSYMDDRELSNWKGLHEVLFRLQKRIFKAVRNGDKAKVRMSSIRKVTRLNQGKKTAGTGGKKSLTFKDWLQLEKTLKQHTKTWKH
jgi:RNA-directed DNA polymerase